MKLDPSALRYLTRDEFRVLTAVEIGMKNHDLVPVPLIVQIAGLRMGGANKILSTLLRHKLLHHERRHYDGYRLTYLGYDFLAMRTLFARGALAGVGRQIGVGKESDIFAVANSEGEQFCMKMHRLGRTSFRAIKNKRDYHGKRGSPSWLYLSRLAATKEVAFMKVLREEGFPVPLLVEANRHSILMSLVQGHNLQAVRKLEPKYVEKIYVDMMDLIERFAQHGLIHGDFNEFNIMVNDEATLTVIDFPQMVSVRHPNARMYFERDVNCVRRFFRKRFNFFHEKCPNFNECMCTMIKDLDVKVAASGWSYKMAKELDRFIERVDVEEEESGESNDDDEEDEDEVQEEYAPLKIDNVGDDVEDERRSEVVLGEVELEAEPKTIVTKFGVVDVSGLQEANIVKLVVQEGGLQGTKEGTATDSNVTADHDGAGGAADGAAAGAATRVDVVSDDDQSDEELNEMPSDAPDAYLMHDYASQRSMASVRRTPGMDDIRRRVRRDFTKKSKKGSSNQFKCNVVKSKEKRHVVNDIKSQGTWL